MSSSAVESGPARRSSAIPRVAVLTSVLLSFISFWRAAALVLNDLASTAYYIGGIAEHKIGPAAPWFILFVMLFATCVRAVYVESCSMFVRGGVYRIVKEALGGKVAKLAVSALVFDFVLTGPISAVSAGHYLHGFLEGCARHLGLSFPVEGPVFAIVVALAMTAYFWRLNVRGLEESSDTALKIVIVTGLMVGLLIVWSCATLYVRGGELPPFSFDAIQLDPHSLGWLEGAEGLIRAVPLLLCFVALGHTLLAMSGEEALAQVYREIEAPKHRNLLKAAGVILVFSLAFTVFCTFACFALVPREQRLAAGDNLLNALVLNFIGPEWLKLCMVAFVVGVGVLILAGAVNTSIFASNAVLNRVAEDGILADWFRHPHHRFGTTSRVIHVIALLQVVTILATRGDVALLGEAYAFGVVWSFVFMSVSMLILRFKYQGKRLLKVPLNFKWKGVEIPVGLGLICFVLCGVAVVNLFTKKLATLSGVGFTAVFFGVFLVSEWSNRRRRGAAFHTPATEKFLLDHRDEIGSATVHLPEGPRRVLVPIRDPNNLRHLKRALERSHSDGTRIVVMTVKVDRSYREGAEQRAADEEMRLISEGGGILTRDQEVLFTRVVQLAEAFGEEVIPLVVPSNNAWYAIARAAHEISADEIYLGLSGQVPPDIQFQQLALMWGIVSSGERELTLRIIAAGGEDMLERV